MRCASCRNGVRSASGAPLGGSEGDADGARGASGGDDKCDEDDDEEDDEDEAIGTGTSCAARDSLSDMPDVLVPEVHGARSVPG